MDKKEQKIQGPRVAGSPVPHEPSEPPKPPEPSEHTKNS